VKEVKMFERKVITTRDEDYAFFLQCTCGAEILEFYGYRETEKEDEIIGIRYFGNDSTNNLNFILNRELLDKLISGFNTLLINSSFPDDVENPEQKLTSFRLERDSVNLEYLQVDLEKELNTFHISKYTKVPRQNKPKLLWCISLYKICVEDFINELTNLQKAIIGDAHKNETMG
jgi:hypothetical protein